MIHRSNLSSGMPHPRLVSAMSGVWAITADGWQGLQSGVMSGSIEQAQVLAARMSPERAKARADHTRTLSMIHEGDEWYFDPTTDAHIVGNLGVFPVNGPLFDRGWFCFQGYDQIIETAQDFAFEALARRDLTDTPDLEAIVMPIHSPGGMCMGLWDACTAIRELRDIVPVYTVANLQIGSAAEALACQGTLSYCSRDSNRGHIGTFTSHCDYSGMLAKEGIRVEYIEEPVGGVKTFFASEKEFSEPAREEYRRGVGHYYEAFVEAVMLGRGLTAQQIAATKAKIYYGAQAIEVGLAHAELTYAELMDILEAGKKPPGGSK